MSVPEPMWIKVDGQWKLKKVRWAAKVWEFLPVEIKYTPPPSP